MESATAATENKVESDTCGFHLDAGALVSAVSAPSGLALSTGRSKDHLPEVDQEIREVFDTKNSRENCPGRS